MSDHNDNVHTVLAMAEEPPPAPVPCPPAESCPEWIVQERKAVQTPDDLRGFVDLSDQALARLGKVCAAFRMKIPPYYLRLIDFEDPDDPLAKMAIPSPRELAVRKGEMDDPIGDANEALNNQPIQAITHRYADRVLLYPTPKCGGYCRHCFRRRLAGKAEYSLTRQQLRRAIDYIAEHSEIHEVILTGGDPLMLGDEALERLLGSLREIPHVWTIRIHSRMPVWNPYRLTESLASILAAHQPVWIVTHFNHPREMSPTAKDHVANLVDRGVPVLNQSVLLKGVNDSVETMRELVWALVRARVKPYYLHQLDKAKGINHFRVGIRRGIRMLRELRGTVPGYAIPHYILDIPGGYGKIPVQYHYLSTGSDGDIIVETPFGDLKTYGEDTSRRDADLKLPTEMAPMEVYPREIRERIGDGADG